MPGGAVATDSAAGASVVTSRTVARTAGVSQATVSRVLQGSDKVRDTTRERVLEAVISMGYSPNILARAMKTRRTQQGRASTFATSPGGAKHGR